MVTRYCICGCCVDCGGVLSSAVDGQITSPGWPNTYSAGTNCTWTIIASRPGVSLCARVILELNCNVTAFLMYFRIACPKCNILTYLWRWLDDGKARLLRTWSTAALLSQTLHHGVICVLPVVVNYSSLDTISPHMVVGLFVSRVRLPGTACAMNCVNRC